MPPKYLNEEWTEEEFLVMFNSRNRRIERANKAAEPAKDKPTDNVDLHDFIKGSGIPFKKLPIQ